MIDTLILSACGVKGLYYVGVFQALVKRKIISQTTIRNLVCCSSGSLFGLLFMLNYSLEFIERLACSIDFESCLDYEDLSDLFSDHGLFSIDSIIDIFVNCLYHKGYSRDITLLELYEATQVNYVVKVYNYTQSKNEYVNYETYPDMPVKTALSMTCSIPLYFKAVRYQDNLYVDGGITGLTPELEDPRYDHNLTIRMSSHCSHSEDTFSYILNILQIGIKKQYKQTNQTIVIPCSLGLSITDFDISEDRKHQMIDHAYDMTQIHIDRYL